MCRLGKWSDELVLQTTQQNNNFIQVVLRVTIVRCNLRTKGNTLGTIGPIVASL